jgi:hypothetical protein
MSVAGSIFIFMLATLFLLTLAIGLVASFLLIIEQLNNQPEDVRDKQYH